jgi:hypothetical protein
MKTSDFIYNNKLYIFDTESKETFSMYYYNGCHYVDFRNNEIVNIKFLIPNKYEIREITV